MVPDSSGFSAIPRDAAEAEEWKRVLDPKNRAGLVKTVQLDYVDLTLKKPLSNGIVPLNHPVNVVATVQLGPGIKSVPLAGRIRVFEKQPNGRRRFETHGYAKATSQDFAKGTIIFEKECRPLDAGTYQVEFRFHHFASRPQTFTVTDK